MGPQVPPSSKANACLFLSIASFLLWSSVSQFLLDPTHFVHFSFYSYLPLFLLLSTNLVQLSMVNLLLNSYLFSHFLLYFPFLGSFELMYFASPENSFFSFTQLFSIVFRTLTHTHTGSLC